MFFNFLIRPFAVVAVLVSVFSIYNTFSIIVTQRTREMALLRALGAAPPAGAPVRRRRGVPRRRSWLRSSGCSSDSAVAIVLKALLGRHRVRCARRRPGAQGEHRVVGVRRSASASRVLTSIIPALKASRVPPLAAMRDVAIERTHRERRPHRDRRHRRRDRAAQHRQRCRDEGIGRARAGRHRRAVDDRRRSSCSGPRSPVRSAG